MNKLANWVSEQLLFLTWMVAVGAVLGSLILSEVLELIPCSLCWYQRIMMFPLAIILAVGVKRNDPNAAYYVLPLSIAGAVIALYHSLLQWGVIKEAITVCSIDSSCAVAQINWFGFITIPFMALLAFILITALMLIYLKKQKSGNA